MRLLGMILTLGSIAVLAGYGVYYLFRDFFTDPGIALPIRVATPALVLGVLLLLASVGRERYQKAKDEHLEGVER